MAQDIIRACMARTWGTPSLTMAMTWWLQASL